MRHLFLMTAVTLCSLASMATDYDGSLNVTVNGTTSQQTATISVDQISGNYNLLIKNFKYEVDGATKNVGNIALTDIPALTANGMTMLYATQDVTVADGDDASTTWIGPSLGEVAVKAVARFCDDYAVVDLDLDLEEAVTATFENVGDHFQLPNGDFELWSASNGEPDRWHGFKTAYGTYASLAQGKLGSASNSATENDNVRPGTTGTYSALITSGTVYGIVNNGTVTNGRLKAGSMFASNAANHSEMDKDATATDAMGNKFYMALYAAPDAIKTWIKFSQATISASYPYATLSAIAFDGNYYQDPEDVTYTNVAAKAQDKKIERGGWRELTVPFNYDDYASNNAAVQAILVTVSTNATPGQGSDGDKVWIDDMELVYNAHVTDFTCQGTTIEGFDADTHEYSFTWESETAPVASDYDLTVDGKSAVKAVNVEETENGYRVVAIATSGDLMTANAYVINYERPVVVVPGDANDDTILNVNDVTTIINYILKKNPDPFNYNNANTNGDDTISVQDVTLIINLILGI